MMNLYDYGIFRTNQNTLRELSKEDRGADDFL